MSAEVLDAADAVGCWRNDRLAAVLFPTADTLAKVRDLCTTRHGSGRMVLVINPEWQDEGNVVSAYGFGKERLKAAEFIEAFQPTFCLRSMRVLGQVGRPALLCLPVVMPSLLCSLGLWGITI
mmetsp:Transcript_25254/g.70658  ORF Transcript_25254/g.70658 Transcript_25254/m.70658 type:complete len:123 (-) Transcript_25254:480-848(-)